MYIRTRIYVYYILVLKSCLNYKTVDCRGKLKVSIKDSVTKKVTYLVTYLFFLKKCASLTLKSIAMIVLTLNVHNYMLLMN